MLVTGDDRIAEALRAEVATLGEPTLPRRAEHVVKALVYATLLQPWLYWMPNAIPQLGLGRTPSTPPSSPSSSRIAGSPRSAA